jgi:hypothetical protein
LPGQPTTVPAVILVAQHAQWLGGEADSRDLLQPFQRTHKKDSFAAQKTLPFNDFSHFAQRLTVRFDRRSMLRFGVIARVARSRAFENPHEYGIFTHP